MSYTNRGTGLSIRLRALITRSGTAATFVSDIKQSFEEASSASTMAWRMLRITCAMLCFDVWKSATSLRCVNLRHHSHAHAPIALLFNPAGRSPKAAGPQIMFAHDSLLVLQSRIADAVHIHDTLRYVVELVRRPGSIRCRSRR